MQSLKTRFITAIILAPVSLFAIYAGGIPFWVLITCVFFLSHYELFYLMQKIDARKMLYPLFFVYTCICFLSYFLVGNGRNAEALVLLLMVISSDVGAYFFGKILGGPKMAQKISPNKTWAGLIGAVICPALVLFVYETFILWDHQDFQAGILGIYILFGAVIGVSSQAGDILISWLKRRANVKDTGSLLPGHGGILDRIDSLMLASLAFIVLEFALRNV